MQRRKVVLTGQCDRLLAQGDAVIMCRGQQSWTWYGREGNGSEPFRVVSQTMLGERLGPTPVENVFPPRMRLQVQGQGADQSVIPFLNKMVGRPTGAGDGTLRLLQRQEILMADEGIPFG